MNDKLKFIMLSAGLGKRMQPLSAHYLPKPMFPLGGSVPISELWVKKAVECGIRDISMNVSVLSQTIMEYFNDGSRFGANISYIEEKEPSGTLGGVCKQVLGNNAKQVNKDEIPLRNEEFSGETLIVVSADIISSFSARDLREMYKLHKSKKAAMTILLTPIPDDKKGEFGTVELADIETINSGISSIGRIKAFWEKRPDSPSNLNNASVYLIEKEFLKYIDRFRTPASLDEKKPFYDFGKHVFPAMLGNLDYLKLPKEFKLYGAVYNGLWLDVGRKRDYLDVNKMVLDGKLDIALPYKKQDWGYLGNNTIVDLNKVKIIPPVIIGDNCLIENGAELGPYASIGDGWKISASCRVANSILWERLSYFGGGGKVFSTEECKKFDNHELTDKANIENCIIAGGAVNRDLKEKVIEADPKGGLSVLPIDYIPAGKRA